ncbi:hypothetical protein KZZ52_43655 [Dactylosporangium sp. AC04546]|uniref:hypothetical protein n=1 Tax=Dactylosporangium sp. AC04546 TaxID=2862460 RepID=UPI001EE02DB1|nr:hypothetical protein [Dactylosporangium sp. AC04546]WVK80811.1 hypothetical protein KZZ52_43655 [Dactylosporangium sp. AC04546]
MRAARIALAAAGLALLGYGLHGWLTEQPGEVPGRIAFLAAGVAAHDFVVVPLVLTAGALTVRFVPPALRIPVQAALAVSAAVSAVALPFVIGAGRIADNPSAFPLAYGRGLLSVLAVVWLAAGLWAVQRVRRARRREHP